MIWVVGLFQIGVAARILLLVPVFLEIYFLRRCLFLGEVLFGGVVMQCRWW